MSETDKPVMAPTGERMVPESAVTNTFWEHVYRYRFAGQFVRGKNVLDIASGEGYGSASLRTAGAATVIGVDISEEAVRHAREKYKIDARVGDGESIPLDAASIDVVVSFETIEHVPQPARFVEECHRVLKPGGQMVMSTPLLETYGAVNNNEHHVSEMPEQESIELFGKFFDDVRVFAQQPHVVPAWGADVKPTDSAVTKAKKVWHNFWARAAVRSGRSTYFYGVERFRGRPTEAINMPAGLMLPFNPYRVRPRDEFGPMGPQYLILVGTKRS